MAPLLIRRKWWNLKTQEVVQRFESPGDHRVSWPTLHCQGQTHSSALFSGLIWVSSLGIFYVIPLLRGGRIFGLETTRMGQLTAWEVVLIIQNSKMFFSPRSTGLSNFRWNRARPLELQSGWRMQTHHFQNSIPKKDQVAPKCSPLPLCTLWVLLA